MCCLWKKSNRGGVKSGKSQKLWMNSKWWWENVTKNTCWILHIKLVHNSFECSQTSHQFKQRQFRNINDEPYSTAVSGERTWWPIWADFPPVSMHLRFEIYAMSSYYALVCVFVHPTGPLIPPKMHMCTPVIACSQDSKSPQCLYPTA